MSDFSGNFGHVVSGTSFSSGPTWYWEPQAADVERHWLVVSGTFGAVVLGTGPAWFREPAAVVTGTARQIFP